MKKLGGTLLALATLAGAFTDAPSLSRAAAPDAGQSAYAAVDPAQPTMPGFLAVANGLCAALGRRPFTPEPRKGYWMVNG